ncbi:RNA-binding protein [Aliiroseovarius crassostreae]|uniref:RNA-binding protein n=1 Tax=Aliiroseovarius crassostreae TaxID=154981 RepID=A0A0P7KDM1_9RHOB|nr:DciA family protein [Aliiroseovarius crassostreae]KPN61599.1 RNA-binding protein [Aliiroseovarius crassostreae]
MRKLPAVTKSVTEKRRRRGFERTSSLLTARIRKAGEARGFSVTRILTHWAEIVGQEVSAIARPVDVSYGRGGMGATLTVLTTGAQAPMLEMQKEQLRTRVNSCYGYNAISRIRITQTAATGFAEGQAQFTPAPPAKKTLDPDVKNQIRNSTADIGDEGLRAALETLGQNIHRKQKPKG